MTRIASLLLVFAACKSNKSEAPPAPKPVDTGAATSPTKAAPAPAASSAVPQGWKRFDLTSHSVAANTRDPDSNKLVEPISFAGISVSAPADAVVASEIVTSKYEDNAGSYVKITGTGWEVSISGPPPATMLKDMKFALEVASDRKTYGVEPIVATELPDAGYVIVADNKQQSSYFVHAFLPALGGLQCGGHIKDRANAELAGKVCASLSKNAK